MYDTNLYKKYENNKFSETICWLRYAMVLIGFVNTYGPMYDDNYYLIILKLNTIIEYYLLTGYYRFIDELYTITNHCIAFDTSAEEIINQIKKYLDEVPIDSINEFKDGFVKYK